MATTINFSGLGSGIDFNVVRDAIIAQRSVPITLLQTKANNYTGRIDALKQLNAALATLTSSAEFLTNRELGSGRSGVSGDSSVATVSATSAAALGNFDINVTRIATSLTQNSRSFASATTGILNGGASSATFQLVKGGAGISTTPTTELANGKTATASSTSGSNTPNKAVDGNLSSRWRSQSTDNEWITVDLGAVADISRVELNWGSVYGTAYKIQVSDDGVNWTDAYVTSTGDGGTDDLTGLSVTGRYVRVDASARSSTSQGYSLNEFKVYGTFDTDFEPTNKTITIDSTNNSLEGLRDAINAANAGVSASIVDIKGDGTDLRLVLNSTETGASGRVELLESSATGTEASLNITSSNPPDGDFSKLDAAFTVNGLSLTRSTNSFSDALTGVNLTLKKTGTSTISITQTTDIENKLRGFVNSYNAIQEFIAGQYKKDANDRPTGVLAGETNLRNIQQQLRNALNTISDANGGLLNSLSQVGITATDDGSLNFDSAVLNERLKESSADVQALLFGKTESDTGIFQTIHEISKGLSDTTTGSVQNAITGYQNSVKKLNESVAFRLESLNQLRELLTRQFAAADAAIGQLNGQGTALTAIIKSLEPRDTR